MSEPKRPLKVFLCHAHADRDAVRVLFSRLKREGVDAWLDKEKLLPGSDWELEIRKAVRESDVVVVCLSKQFNQAGFRQKEVRIALDTAMEQPEGEIFIIPARLDECENLESLMKWHWVDLFEVDGYHKLIGALRARADRIGATLRIRGGGQSTTSRPKSKEPEKTAEPPASSVNIGDAVFGNVIATETRETQSFEKAEREAVEKAAHEKTERDAAEQATREELERETIEKAAREKLEREAAEKAAQEKAEREVAEKNAREKAEREASEKAAREKAEHKAAEKIAREKAERETAEKAIREKIEREALEKTAREKTEREADEKVAREKIERDKVNRESTEKAKRVETKRQFGEGESKGQRSRRSLNMGTVFSSVGFLGAIGVLAVIAIFVIGLLSDKRLSSTLFPTSNHTPSSQASFSNTPTKTSLASPTSTKEITPTPKSLPTEIIPTPESLPTEITDNTGVQMVLVSAGNFIMGSNNGDDYSTSDDDEKPAHTIYLDAFYIDKYEISIAQYKDCMNAKACEAPIKDDQGILGREHYF